MNEIWGEKPGKKTLQKIIFLVEQKGINLNYEYGLHFYGPYSAALDATTAFLSSDGIIKFDCSGYSHRMSTNENFNVLSEGLSLERENEIKDIIIRFKGMSPSELELLTTAIYAYNNLEIKTKESVINGVQKIKGTKYTKEQILSSLNNFIYFDKSFTA